MTPSSFPQGSPAAGPANLAPLVASPTGMTVSSSSVSQRSPSSACSLPIRGGIKNAEGPLGGSRHGLLSCLQHSATMSGSDQTEPVDAADLPSHSTMNVQQHSLLQRPHVDEETLELLSTEMSFSALYMHEMHRKKVYNPYYENMEDIHARHIWQTESPQQPDNPGLTPSSPVPSSSRLPTQQEEDEEEEEEDNDNDATDVAAAGDQIKPLKN